jgi:hypothetical protein
MSLDNYEKLEKIGEGTYGKVYKAKDRTTGALVALKKTRLEVRAATRAAEACAAGSSSFSSGAPGGGPHRRSALPPMQMEEEGVPSTTLREVSLLKMLSESNHIVKWVPGAGALFACAAMRPARPAAMPVVVVDQQRPAPSCQRLSLRRQTTN